jgi:hypothetical protein
MKKMRNIKTGRVAVYDAELVQSGRWVELDSEPKVEAKKPGANDVVAVQDEVKITVTRGKDESKQRKA